MSNRQDIAFLTPFANDAETTLPGVPIGGTSYRDPAFTALGPGWPYKTKVESQDFNQVLYIQTLLMRQLSNQGVLDYSDKEDYTANNALVKDDGGLYLCTANNGPASAVKQPSTEPLFWRRIDFTSVENRIRGQQNWNIPDPSGDPLISATPTLYTVGEFPAVNVEVVNANAVNLRKDGDLIKGDSGTLRHYARGAYRAGVIDETTEYMGIKDHTGAQLEAGVATGVTKGNNGTDLYVDVDLSQFPNGYRFAGVSSERGLWPEVSDDEASKSFDLRTVGGANYDGVNLVIRKSRRIDSINRFATGSYAVSIDPPMPDANYIVSIISNETASSSQAGWGVSAKTANGFNFNIYVSGALRNAEFIDIAIMEIPS